MRSLWQTNSGKPIYFLYVIDDMKSIPVRRKIFVIFFIISMAATLQMAFIDFKLGELNDAVKEVAEFTVPSVILVQEMKVTANNVRKDQFALVANVEQPNINQWINTLQELEKRMGILISTYEEGLWDERDRQACSAVASSWKEYGLSSRLFLDAIRNKESEPAYQILKDNYANFLKVIEAVEALVKLNQEYTNEDTLASEQAYVSAVRLSVVSMVTIIVLMIVLGWSLTNYICRPLELVKNLAASVASGDLTHRLPRAQIGDDELGQLADACIAMQQNLQALLESIAAGTVQLGGAIDEMSTVSGQASQGMIHQQQQIDSMVSAMEQMRSTVGDIAKNTESASHSASDATEVANRGVNLVTQGIDGITQAEAVIQAAGHQVAKLEEESKNIGMVVDVIRDIAEQTNLLALNAAIEAARAGEQGRGFAVVADEVRTLAGRTQESTSRIVEIVGQLQSRAEEAGAKTKESCGLITQCVSQSHQAVEAIQKTSESVTEITTMSIQVATACSQQAVVSDEVARNMSAIDQTSKEVALGAEQVSQTNVGLSQLAGELQGLVQKFKLS